MMKATYLMRHFSDNLGLMDMLVASKIPVIIEPLITIKFLPFVLEPFQGTTAIIVTSRYGLKGLIKHKPHINRKTSILAVGDSTTYSARQLGFKNIVTGSGTVESLLPLIQEQSLCSQHFIYARGDHVSFPLEEHLAHSNISCTSVITYDAVATEQLTQTLCQKIQEQHILCAPFYSARTAQIFTHLIQKHQLESFVKSIRFIGFSQAIVNKLVKLGPHVITAEELSDQSAFKQINALYAAAFS